MDVLYVYEHFDNLGSMNTALRTEAERMLVSMGYTVADSDLYRMGFRPVLNERDFPDRALADRFVPNIETRHALSNSALSTPSTRAAATWASP